MNAPPEITLFTLDFPRKGGKGEEKKGEEPINYELPLTQNDERGGTDRFLREVVIFCR